MFLIMCFFRKDSALTEVTINQARLGVSFPRFFTFQDVGFMLPVLPVAEH